MPMVMEAAVSGGDALNTALTTSLDPSSFLTEFLKIMPWIGGLVTVAFLIYEGRKLIKGSAKMKVRV